MIFPNTTLESLVQACPTTLEALSKVSGFGGSGFRLGQFGEQIIKICQRYNYTSIQKITQTKRKKEYGQVPSESKMISWTLHQDGKSITDIAAERNLAESTITQHLTDCIDSGAVQTNTINWDLLPSVNEEIEAKVFQYLHTNKYEQPFNCTLTELKQYCGITQENCWNALRCCRSKFYVERKIEP
jgi:ATP-dependent DNA helicase RecQ